ncbi:DUF1353 domain-containing protein [Rhodococcus sp. USK13]|uniref:DUF1353 domain-containing protein n=1 Tax=Rhodococcus sp. USK13 TaxID=2806442 RepID=UPI001BCCF3B5|nr:DUF1353 domain-containing protein [Rhodococcus sp. USK13]
MPFQVSADDPARPQPSLRALDHKYFQLTDHFVYVHGETVVTVPGCAPEPCVLRTDLASVPAPLRGLLAPYGRQLLPAIMHDDLCRCAEAHGKSGMALRRRADELFRTALLDEGVGPFRSRIFWIGVEVGRFWTFTTYTRFLLIAHHILGMVCWVVGVPWAIATSHYPTAVGLLALPCVLSLLWRRDFPVALLGCILLPVVAPTYLLTLATAAVLWIPDVTAWLFGRRVTRKPPPLGPPTTVLR